VQLTRRDAGFTLIELLVTVVILGLIMLPLGNAIIGVLHNYNATSDRLALSHDAQISAAYFGRDVAAVGLHDYPANGAPLKASVQVNAQYNTGGQTCGTAATPAALVRFLSDDWDNSGPQPVLGTDVVAYYLAGTQLHRLRCTGSATPASDVILAHYVTGTPKVTCVNPVVCDGASVPEQVNLTFTVSKSPTDSYQLTLTGQRRQTDVSTQPSP